MPVEEDPVNDPLEYRLGGRDGGYQQCAPHGGEPWLTAGRGATAGQVSDRGSTFGQVGDRSSHVLQQGVGPHAEPCRSPFERVGPSFKGRPGPVLLSANPSLARSHR
jgi:hypothetical protein